MSTQVVGYLDLRKTYDNEPPVYKTSLFEKKDLSDLDQGRRFELDLSESSQSRQSSRQDSRSGSRSSASSSKQKNKGKSKVGKEASDLSTTSDGDNTADNKRSKSTLETVREADSFENSWDLLDEESWGSVPVSDIPGRYNQYRKLSQNHIKDLEDKLQLNLARMHRKVQTLKAQFQEHKSKWDAERQILMDQVQQAQYLQTDAEKEADSTITQLENFITEQERLELEEAKKRQEMAASAELLKQVTPRSVQPSPNEDLNKLMQQTDDAKALASTVPAEIVQEKKNIDAKELGKLLDLDSGLQPIQQIVIKNLKTMMSDPEDKLPAYQQKILESLRSALKVLSDTKSELEDEEILRTLTVVSLASQLTQESMLLGVRPNSLFKTLADLSKRLLDEKENELKLMLLDNTTDDGFSEISFESGTEAEISISTLRDLPILDDVSEVDIHSEKPEKLPDTEETAVQTDEIYKDAVTENDTENQKQLSDDQEESPVSASSAKSQYSSAITGATADDENTGCAVEEDTDEANMSVLKTRPMSGRSFTTNSPMSDTSDTRFNHSIVSQTDSSIATSSKPNYLVVKLPDGGSIEDDDFRISSAKSRHSLRSHYKSKIQETKKAAEDRKYKAAALSKSITQVKDEEEKIIDEDHEDYLKGFGYSITGELLPEHPVVQEYLKSHNSTISFKEALTKILLDKDMMSASQLISDLEIHHFKKEAKIFPQLEKMTKNTSMVLDEIISLLNSILFNDRDPPVSSMMYISRDPTCMSREKTPDTSRTPAPTRESIHSNVNNQGLDNVDNEYIRDLQHQCHLLRDHIDETSKKHEEQMRHNTVVMMEMQDTINGLQRELSTLGKAPRSRSVTPRLQLSQAPSPESSIMFTRLDAERNAKIMKKAVNDAKLDQNKYKDAVSQMDKYVSLPAQRLAHLVQKYVHHYRMKYIEETVQKSRTLDDDVFDVLDKMEDLQNQRAKRWADKMDEMGTERLRMANLLMETLDSIENESGIFLIKPMYSYRGRELLQRYTGKLSRPIRSRKANSSTVLPENLRSFGPAPTPASNIRSIHREVSSLQNQDTRQVTAPSPKGTFDGTDGGVAGAAVNWVGTSSNSTWNMSASQPSAVRDDVNSFHNTPRILELDINRMLIGQNNISTRLCYPLTDDRLVNASQNTLRTYVTVNRPAVQPKGQDRPHSVTGARDSCAPPTTPQQISSSEVDVPQKLPSTPPLPPINKTRNISG
ncbi:hypothetical protein SNE40_007080 [Patella caerulea]|uniref:Uncharacterized protein n=1 Tax=Patella caerulea TaxID=87958 RepID=A0AAN8PUH4_PATCE